MSTIETTKAQVESDGRTVWLNAADGSCVGRFSRFGVDLHRTVSEQMAGLPECLDCTHECPGPAEWKRFQDGALLHHGVAVSDRHRPRFINLESTT